MRMIVMQDWWLHVGSVQVTVLLCYYCLLVHVEVVEGFVGVSTRNPHACSHDNSWQPTFAPLTTTTTRTTTTRYGPTTRKSTSSSRLWSSRASDMSTMMREMRDGLSQDEDANMIMDALRGKNLNDDDKAVAGLEMRLVNVQLKDGESGLPYQYDPKSLKEFFSKRPLAVLTRILQVTAVGGGFFVKTITDQVLGRMNNNPELEVQRARELRDLMTSLGPFFIKIGQALSIRPDVLSPRSMVELQKLCDKVPSYDSRIAFATIQKELGRSVNDLFIEITSEPVAAASLGQVYKAVLRDTGDTVAVKVQRPGVLETVSLDLYLARELGLFLRNFPIIVQRLDPVSLLDEFAYRFFNELDYNLECDNGLRIQKEMKSLPMVIIPQNYPQYTSRRVHVAEWIVGEKLSQSKADDVGALVNLGVIAYLTQLLESGFFHADPHPGNMMRTTDGKLAILDFGLMTEVTEDQKYGMIEAIAHLINRDYSEIGQDFINLDFIPKGTDTTPIVPALTQVFDVALAGGGAKSINFQELAADLAEITFEYPFRIPPYFALVIRAISVLEGIALVGNPNFAIVDEAFPYIARRLMTDRSPRLRAALRYMIYGREGDFNAENVIDLLEALEKFTAVRDEADGSAFKVDGVRGSRNVGSAGDFRGSQKVDLTEREEDDSGRFRVSSPSPSPTTTTTTTMNGQLVSTVASVQPQIAVESLVDQTDDERTVRQALRFFFAPEGDVFRDFMLEEIVTVADAISRDGLRELARSLGLRNLPVPTFFQSISPPITETDRKMVRQIEQLVGFLLGDFEEAADTRRLQRLIPIVREFAPQLREFGLLLVARLTEKNLSRGLMWATNRLNQADASFAQSLTRTYRSLSQ